MKEREEMQPNPIAATALKSTQSTVCASEQMAGLVAVKTMGRVSTHGLSQTHTHTLKHTHSHIPMVHFTHMVNKKFIILRGLLVGGGDTGNSIWPFHPLGCQHVHLSCRYNIWTAGLLTSDVKNAGLTHVLKNKK